MVQPAQAHEQRVGSDVGVPPQVGVSVAAAGVVQWDYGDEGDYTSSPTGWRGGSLKLEGNGGGVVGEGRLIPGGLRGRYTMGRRWKAHKSHQGQAETALTRVGRGRQLGLCLHHAVKYHPAGFYKSSDNLNITEGRLL